MTDMTKGNSGPQHTAPAPKANSQGYASKLDEILAKAGQNNPIAKMQAKPAPQAAPAPPPAQPAQNLPQTTGMAPQPAAPVVPAPAQTTAPQPQSPQDKLSQILAMAGKTPAQRAQAQAAQAQASQAANVQAVLAGYVQAVAQDPRKILQCEIEFQSTSGASDTVYFKCYADQAGNVYWDAFGVDIGYIVPTGIGNYQLPTMDDYFRGIPDQVFQADMATATIHSNQIV